jgi:hypothetical protein
MMANIQISDVTTTLTDGDGVFDVLMRSIDAHLDKQYTSGRIKGSDYATVYLGALQAVLAQAMQFVLSEQEAEKKLDLMAAQIDAINSEKTVKENQSSKDLLVKDSQMALQGAQKLAIDSEKGVKEAQSGKDLLLKQEQIDASKANTLMKQIQSTKQNAVYDKQALGFDRDYKYKVAKSMVDLRTAGLTQGEAGIAQDGANQIVNALLTDAALPAVAALVDPTG